MIYYGTRLSENISLREPEGYLLCLNVPVARTGVQEYAPEELGLPSPPSPRLLPVCRPEAEVFSPETVASFEGMPVTDGHPPDGVTVNNIRAFQKGHAHNVRRGAGDESDLLLADLIVTDPGLIEAILDGKREISCGYTYDLCEENRQLIQRKIRGNHVAVVDAGRAGHRVSIKDEHPAESLVRATDAERRTPVMKQPVTKQPVTKQPVLKKSILKKLTCMARDGDPEAVEALMEAVEEILETPSEAPETTAVVIAAAADPEPAEAPVPPAGEAPAADSGSDILSAILERLDQLIALLTPAAPAEGSDSSDLPAELAEVVEEALEAVAETASSETGETTAEEISAMVGEILEPAVSTVLEPEEEESDECDPDPREVGDALRAALQAVRPALKRLSCRERSLVCADIARRLSRSGVDSGDYAALVSAGPRKSADPAELGRKIMAARNPHYK